MKKTLDPRSADRNPIAAASPEAARSPALTRFHAARLRAALLEVAGALSSRPMPRDVWDDLARGDAEFRSLWLDKDVQLCRCALASAATEGPGVLAATAQRVERYFAERTAAALYGFDVGGSHDLADSLLELTHESADVICAAAEAAREPSLSKLETLRADALEIEHTIETVIALSSRRLADTPERIPARLHR